MRLVIVGTLKGPNNKDNEIVQSAFQDNLTQLRNNNCENLPTPEPAILNRTIARLRRDKVYSRCLQVGEKFPDFYEMLESGPVILNFFRGDCCWYCKTEIEAYENIQSELTSLGCACDAISPQRPKNAGQRAKNHQVFFGRNNKIARGFGIITTLEYAEWSLFKLGD